MSKPLANVLLISITYIINITSLAHYILSKPLANVLLISITYVTNITILANYIFYE